MNDEPIGPDLSHPDAAIRLASAVHRFPCPEIGAEHQISFSNSFRTAGSHPTTRAVTSQADSARASLSEALVGSSKGTTVSHKSIVRSAQKYLPFIHQVLLTCKVQPEVARLDERLIFEWSSGVEQAREFFQSEALMFEMVMTISCEGMGLAGDACDESTNGNFAAASRGFKQAAGVMQFLAEDQLPKWIARGSNVEDNSLPSEATVGVCDAFKALFLAVAQQMAVATVLVKPGTPNWGLLAKLCLGVAEQLELFTSNMRSKASSQMPKIDPNFFTLVTFQVNIQRGLSLYFQSRGIWDSNAGYGLAICLLNEATTYLRTRDSATSRGLPDIGPNSSLRALSADVTDMRGHMRLLLKSWEKDNSLVYFDKVPQSIPESEKVKNGIMMMKPEPYELKDVEPVPLSLPTSNSTAPPPGQEISDEELARQLQSELNTGSSPAPVPATKSASNVMSSPPNPAPSAMSGPPRPVPSMMSSPPKPKTSLASSDKSDEDMARELQAKLNRGEDC